MPLGMKYEKHLSFTIDRSPDLEPVFMIGIEDMFLDYEFSFEDLIELQEVISKAIVDEKNSMN